MGKTVVSQRSLRSRFFAFMIAAVMVFSMLPVGLVRAEDVRITSIEADDVTVLEHTRGWFDMREEGSFYRYDDKPEHIKVTLSNEQTFEGRFDEVRDACGRDLRLTANQPEGSEWSVGQHTVIVSADGVETSFKINVTETEVESIELDPIVIYEGGRKHTEERHYWDNEKNEDVRVEYEAYDIPLENLTIRYKSGKIESGSFYELRNRYDGLIDLRHDQSDLNVWGLGTHKVLVTVLGYVKEFDAQVIESPLSDIETQPVTVYEGGSKRTERIDRWDDEKQENVTVYYEAYEVPYGVFKLIFKEGDPIEGRDYELRDMGLRVDIWTDQSDTNEWTVGKHKAYISVLGFTKEFEVELVESPVADIELDPIVIYENGRKHTERRDYWDDEKQEDVHVEFEAYDIPLDGFKIIFKDNTSEEGDFNDLREKYNKNLNFYTDQSDTNVWGVGKHEVTFNVLGFTKVIEAEVVTSPIEDIEIDYSPIYFEEPKRHVMFDYWDSEKQEQVITEYDAYDIRIGQAKVTFKEGDPYEGEFFDFSDVYGEWIDVITDQSETNSWGIGKHEFTVSVMGFTKTFEIEVIESELSDVEIAPVKVYEGGEKRHVVRNEWDSEKQEDVRVEYDEYEVRTGVIRLIFKNGDVVEGRDYELRNDYGIDSEMWTDQSDTNVWGLGKHTATFYVLGFRKDFEVEVVESPVEDIELDPIVIYEGGSTHTEYRDYWDDEKQEDVHEEFEAYDIPLNGFKIRFKDGRVEEGDFNELRDSYNEQLNFFADESPTNVWGVGKHEVTFNVLGFTKVIEAEVIPSPIEDIIVDPLTIYENDRVHTDFEWVWDDEKQDNVPVPYKCYEVPVGNIKVIFKDGETFEGQMYEFEEKYGEWIEFRTDQAPGNEWEKGEHTYTLSVMGFKKDFEVTLTETPIEDVTLVQPSVIYVGAPKYPNYYYETDPDTGEETETEYKAYNVPVMEVTIKYKNGKKETADLHEYAEENGIIVNIETDQYKEEWGVGDHTATLSLLGFSKEFTVKVIEHPAKSITLDRDTVYVTEGIDGYYVGEGAEKHFVFFVGDVVTTFKLEMADEYGGITLDSEHGYFNLNGEYYPLEILEFDKDPSEWKAGETHTRKVGIFGLEATETFVTLENEYVSAAISGTEELILTLTKKDETTEDFKVITFIPVEGVVGDLRGDLITEGRAFTHVRLRYDATESPIDYDKSIQITVGEMETNVLEGCEFFRLANLPERYLELALTYRMVTEGKEQMLFKGYDGHLTVSAANALLTIAADICATRDQYVDIEGDDNTYVRLTLDEAKRYVASISEIKNFDATRTSYKVEDGTVLVPIYRNYRMSETEYEKTEDGFRFSAADEFNDSYERIVIETDKTARIKSIVFVNDTLDPDPGDVEIPIDDLPDGEVLYGDANGDGKVTALDIIRLKKNIASDGNITVSDGADANGDGTVDSIDLVRLKRYFAEYDPVTKESSVKLGPEN